MHAGRLCAHSWGDPAERTYAGAATIDLDLPLLVLGLIVIGVLAYVGYHAATAENRGQAPRDAAMAAARRAAGPAAVAGVAVVIGAAFLAIIGFLMSILFLVLWFFLLARLLGGADGSEPFGDLAGIVVLLIFLVTIAFAAVVGWALFLGVRALRRYLQSRPPEA